MEVRSVVGEQRYEDGFKKAVDLLTEKVTLTCESLPGARVVFCAIPQQIVEYCLEAGSHLRKSGSKHPFFSRLLELEEQHGQARLFPRPKDIRQDENIVYRNLRRALKAKTMKLRKPLQLGLETSLFSSRSQHPATKAWNFCVAQYYKATGALPWKLDGMDPNTCFAGISFFHQIAEDSFRMRTSLAQVFSGDGEAFVVRGHPFNWDQRKSPHLPREGAAALMRLIVKGYKEFHSDQAPQRVVIHKTSRFYKDELEGFLEGRRHSPIYLVPSKRLGRAFFAKAATLRCAGRMRVAVPAISYTRWATSPNLGRIPRDTCRSLSICWTTTGTLRRAGYSKRCSRSPR